MTVLVPEKLHVTSPPRRRRAKTRADALCAEHRLLATQLELLDEVADEVDTATAEHLRRDVDRAYDLLARKVLPHEKAELSLRTRLATRDAKPLEVDHDHEETCRLVARIGALKARLARGDTAEAPAEIRQALYELHALTRLHFADQVCDPDVKGDATSSAR